MRARAPTHARMRAHTPHTSAHTQTHTRARARAHAHTSNVWIMGLVIIAYVPGLSKTKWAELERKKKWACYRSS